MADKKGRNPFVWIILILLFVGLLGFGTGGLGGGVRDIGTVGDKTITIASYQAALNNQIRAIERQTGQPMSLAQAREIGLEQAVMQQLVVQRTLDNEAENIGISVGDQRVRDEVLRIPGFQNLSGQFDRELYRRTLQSNGQTEAAFESQIRDEIARSLLQAGVVGGLSAPEAFANTVVQYIGETRDVTFATLTADDLTAPVPGATDADVQAYYDANPDQFTAPEQRDITYAWITPSMIAPQITVDETTLLDLYEQRIDQYVQPERRLVERLVFSDQASADAAMAQITAGEATFDTLVALRGLSLSDVDLGDVARSDLDGAADAVFAAAPGDVVGPLDTALGPALFRMNAVLAAETSNFEDVRDDLRAELAAGQAARQIEASAEQINDLIAGGATIEDLADRTDLTLASLAYSADSTDPITAYDGFRSVAETTNPGDFLTLHELSDGGLFVLRVNAITPPAVRPLDDVREAVTQAVIATRTQDMIRAQATETAARISPLTAFAELGLTPTDAANLTRTSFTEGTPPGFLDTVFGLEVGAVTVIDTDTGALIVRLNRTTPPDPENPQTTAQIEAVTQSATQGIAQDIFQAFSTSVQNRTDVAINQSVLNALSAQLQ